MTDTNKMIGEHVRALRTANGISLEKMAASLAVPISGNQLAKYETGVSRWPADLLCEIAHLLRVDVGKLLGLANSRPATKGDDEWKAEKYKNVLRKLSAPKRENIYRMIDMAAKL